MYALDFEYDGHYLSEYGFIVCDFNGSSGANIVTNGSKITFKTVSHHRGKKYGLTGTQYDGCIQTKIQICKNPELYDNLAITNDEYRDIMRWLNRHEFLKFRVRDVDDCISDPCFYEASFNIDKIKIREILYGLELSMETNKPFGYGEEQYYELNFTNSDDTLLVCDFSDEIGFTYPSVTVHCEADGDLYIYNVTEPCTVLIKNCTAGEVININGDTMVVTTSRASHDIANDFNYEFLKIGNTMENRYNKISVSLPCKLEIRYFPIIKDAP